MPTYKYRREDGTTFTIRQKITADALEECPETGQKVERVITGGMGFQLKGGGWYNDGYSSAGASSQESNGESAGSNASSSEGGSDGQAGHAKADGTAPGNQSDGSSSGKGDASTTKSDAA